MQRLLDKPLQGYGFGFVTIGYDSYEELGKPYLLELDLINFITKIGLFMFFLYVISYIIYFYIYFKIKYLSTNDLMYSWSYILLIGSLLLYSLVQTFHSSMLFWLFYVFSFGYITLNRNLLKSIIYDPEFNS